VPEDCGRIVSVSIRAEGGLTLLAGGRVNGDTLWRAGLWLLLRCSSSDAAFFFFFLCFFFFLRRGEGSVVLAYVRILTCRSGRVQQAM
jgi:hypothetical protein